MPNEERTEKGTFAQGNKGGPGRPTKARELAYLAVVAEEISLDDFRQVIRKAKEDAVKGEDGRTRDYGRRFLADYLIGRPRQTLHITPGPGAHDEYDDLSDEELRAIKAEAERDDAAAADARASGRDSEDEEEDTG